jgi:hypothetical protein
MKPLSVNGYDIRAGGGVRTRRAPCIAVPKGERAYRTDCPSCKAPLVVMSQIMPDIPSPAPPAKGDAIRCDHCGKYCVVNGFGLENRIAVIAVEIPTA